MSYKQNVDDNDPLISIVIPTKNRAKYAIWTILACLDLPKACEIVVADSSSDDSLYDRLLHAGVLHRINYIRTDPDSSVVENFNAGVAKVTAPYVTCIGDDDLVTPAIFEVADFALRKGVECFNFTFPITYWWPDFVHRRRGKVDAATIAVTPYSGKTTALIPQNEMAKAIERFGSGPQDMPRVYAGLVSTDLVRRIKDKYGSLFGGVSPDIYSSTLLASECSSFVKLDYPVIVPGVSGGSTSGTSSNGKHVGRLRENDHIAPFKDLVWDCRIPEFYSVPTVWAYSMLKALEKIEKQNDANYISAYLKCFLYHRSFLRETMNAARSVFRRHSVKRICRDVVVAIRGELGFVVGAVYRRISEKISPTKFLRLESCENTLSAAEKISTTLRPLILDSGER